jgi:hypothetical protein
MPVNPVWPGVVLALTARVVGADPVPTPVPTPVVPFRVPEFPRAQLLGGKPFPAVTPFAPLVAKPDRTLYVSAGAKDGDGSKAHPWGDLQAALRAIGPGDQLRVGPGDYSGPLRIDETCPEGTGRHPIQLVFDVKAKLSPGEGAGTVGVALLTIARPYWNVTGVYVALDQSASPGISVEGTAHDVTLDRARVSGGSAPSVLIGGETLRVRIGNAKIAKTRLDRASPDAVGILIAAGARDALLANNRLSENPGGSVRVRAPEADGKAAGGLQILGNTIRDDAATAIEIEAADGIRIAGNTIFDSPTWTGTRGIALGSVERGVVQWNHVEDCAIGIQVGAASSEGREPRVASAVSVDHNYLVDTASVGTGVRVEAARDARVVHNILDGVAEAFAVVGGPPRTQGVTVVNNLVIGVAKVGFALDDPKAVAHFDYNVFSPRGEAGGVVASVGGREVPLAKALQSEKMTHTKLVPGVKILNNDLARIEGAEIRDQGSPLGGFPHRGSAPDIGIEER